MARSRLLSRYDPYWWERSSNRPVADKGKKRISVSVLKEKKFILTTICTGLYSVTVLVLESTSALNNLIQLLETLKNICHTGTALFCHTFYPSQLPWCACSHTAIIKTQISNLRKWTLSDKESNKGYLQVVSNNNHLNPMPLPCSDHVLQCILVGK